MLSEYVVVNSTVVSMRKTTEERTTVNSEINRPWTSIASVTNDKITRQASSRSEKTVKTSIEVIDLQQSHSVVNIQRTTTGFLIFNASTVSYYLGCSCLRQWCSNSSRYLSASKHLHDAYTALLDKGLSLKRAA